MIKDPVQRRKSSSDWKKKNPEKIRNWQLNNKDKIRGYAQKYAEQAKARKRKRILLKLYGISVEQYDELFAKQKGVCAICGTNNGKRQLAVDHCHDTGKVRGLLCVLCNTGIGSLRDDPVIVEKALKYLTNVV